MYRPLLYSSTLAWKMPWTEEPGGLQSMGSLRVRHDWATSLHFCFNQCSNVRLKVSVKFSRWCQTLCNLKDCSPPGSSVHVILQARILGCIAMPSSIQPRSPTLQADSLPSESPGKPPVSDYLTTFLNLLFCFNTLSSLSFLLIWAFYFLLPAF